ncbi:MAG: HAMP domain-containing histidine kinase [Defluviitaleaceae bacterium]|nr:HAMP domain-containing histidine kinase [Defluviitaleaceae bacterium]
MKDNIKSFAARFIFKSVFVILLLFLIIYFLFNQITAEFIRNTTESELTVQIYNSVADTVAVLGNGWRSMDMSEAVLHFLDLPADATPGDSLALALLSDTISENYVIINERGVIATSAHALIGSPNLLGYRGRLVDTRLFLAEYYRENRGLFEVGETTTLYIGDYIFHLKSVPTDYLGDQVFPAPPSPLTILLYTDVTEMITFKNTINQILIIVLSLSAFVIFTTTLSMSIKFNQSIKRLSHYAQELGYGQFDAKIDPLKYIEFQKLASSMTDMANMLATYEVNQKQFFQNASHELRTPLMAVQCYSEGILADVFEPNDAAHIINSEIEKMTQLVGSILYLSRIDHQTFQLEPTSTNEFLTACYNQIKVLADNNTLRLTFTPLDQDLQINIDNALLDRAVLNILSNALRYAQTDITLSVEKYLNRNIFANLKQEVIRINITNDGEQIDEKDLPYIFDRFYKGKGGHTGLGLAITKEIMIALGGKVTVFNLENGVCFTIELPVYESKMILQPLSF